MRGMVGLIGLLIAVAIIAFLFVTKEGPTLRKGQDAKNEASRISGRGADGTTFAESFNVEPEMRDGKLKSMLVKSVMTEGPMAAYFGLQQGDMIVAVGDQKVSDINDDKMAEAMIQEAPQRSQQLTVIREGQRLTLPVPASPVAPAPTADGSSTAAPAPEPAPAPKQRTLQDQVNDVVKPR